MAKEPRVGIPTLNNITNPVLTSVVDVVTYLIQFLFANPGSTSSLNEGEMISFRKLVSHYGTKSLNTMADRIGTMLTSSIQHYFPHQNYQATATIEFEKGTGDDGSHLGNYNVSIAVRDPNGNPVCPFSKFWISQDGSQFKAVL